MTLDQKPKGNFAAPDPMHQKNRNKKEKSVAEGLPSFCSKININLLFKGEREEGRKTLT